MPKLFQCFSIFRVNKTVERWSWVLHWSCRETEGLVLKWDAIQWEETTSSRGMLDEVWCSTKLLSMYPSQLNVWVFVYFKSSGWVLINFHSWVSIHHIIHKIGEVQINLPTLAWNLSTVGFVFRRWYLPVGTSAPLSSSVELRLLCVSVRSSSLPSV
jgi:hypothetical protein